MFRKGSIVIGKNIQEKGRVEQKKNENVQEEKNRNSGSGS